MRSNYILLVTEYHIVSLFNNKSNDVSLVKFKCLNKQMPWPFTFSREFPSSDS